MRYCALALACLCVYTSISSMITDPAAGVGAFNATQLPANHHFWTPHRTAPQFSGSSSEYISSQSLESASEDPEAAPQPCIIKRALSAYTYELKNQPCVLMTSPLLTIGCLALSMTQITCNPVSQWLLGTCSPSIEAKIIGHVPLGLSLLLDFLVIKRIWFPSKEEHLLDEVGREIRQTQQYNQLP